MVKTMTKFSYIFRSYVLAYLSADLLFRIYYTGQQLADTPRMIDGEYIRIYDFSNFSPFFSFVPIVIVFVFPMSIGVFIAFLTYRLLFTQKSFLFALFVAFLGSFSVLTFLIFFGGERDIPYLFNLIASIIVAPIICGLGSLFHIINKPACCIKNREKGIRL